MSAPLQQKCDDNSYQTYVNNDTNTCQTYVNTGFNNDELKDNDIYEVPENQEIKVTTNTYNCCQNVVYKLQTIISETYTKHKSNIRGCTYIVLLLLYFCYFGYALYYKFGNENSYRLLICTVIGFALIIGKVFVPGHINVNCCDGQLCVNPKFKLFLRWSLRVIVFIFLVVYIIVDIAIERPTNLISVAGLFVYLLLLYITSTNPSKVNWHPVFWGIALQYLFALLILRTHWGYSAFIWLGDRVTEFLSFADEGAKFVFDKEYYTRHTFAFKIMPIVVYFSAVLNILYYLGVMQFIISHFGRFLSYCLDTTPAESVNAAANMFVSMTAAPLMIKPFLEDMTDSEFHAVMTGGFATIAGGILGAYIAFGVPAIHLLSASIMSAPAALAISKLMCPETETSVSSLRDFTKMAKPPEKNIIEAASTGATQSIKLVAAIIVNVMAFLSLLKFLNSTLTWFGNQVGIEELTFQLICSYVLYPVSFFMGADIQDCRKVAELVGIKTFTNEFIAYDALSTLIHNKETFVNYTSTYNDTGAWFWRGDDIILTHWNNQILDGGIISDRSVVISTYALCGFSNFGSIGITLGVLGALAPTRKASLSKLVLRAMIAGNIACFLTACIAGLLYKDF